MADNSNQPDMETNSEEIVTTPEVVVEDHENDAEPIEKKVDVVSEASEEDRENDGEPIVEETDNASETTEEEPTEKVLFDAENGIDETNNDQVSPEEMMKSFGQMLAGMTGTTFEGDGSDEKIEAVEGTVEPGDESVELKPDYAFDKDSDEVQQYKQNVFKNKRVDEAFVTGSECSVCHFVEKKTLRLVAYKGLIRRKSKVIGTASICQNCGHFSLHGYDVQDMLHYLSGKGYKVKFEEEKDGEEIQ